MSAGVSKEGDAAHVCSLEMVLMLLWKVSRCAGSADACAREC